MSVTLPPTELLLTANPAVSRLAGPPPAAQPGATAPSPGGSFASTLRAVLGAPTAAAPDSVPQPTSADLAALISARPRAAPLTPEAIDSQIGRQAIAGQSAPQTGNPLPLPTEGLPVPAVPAAVMLPKPTDNPARSDSANDDTPDLRPVVAELEPPAPTGIAVAMTLTEATPAPERSTVTTRPELVAAAAQRGTDGGLETRAQADGDFEPGGQQRDTSPGRPVVAETSRLPENALRSAEPAPSGALNRLAAFSTGAAEPAAVTTAAPAFSGTELRALIDRLPEPELARSLQPGADPQRFSSGLGERLLVMTRNGTQTARVQLHPEHLGPLDVRITVEDDTARVWFGAQHAQTREALESALPRLREMLAEHGLDLAQADIDSGQREHAADPDGNEPAIRAKGGEAEPETMPAAIDGAPLAHASPRLVDTWA